MTWKSNVKNIQDECLLFDGSPYEAKAFATDYIFKVRTAQTAVGVLN